MSKKEEKLPVLGGAKITKLLCSKIEIKDGYNVLVASVNLRESLIYIAKNFNCNVFGINEVPQIVMEAKGEIIEVGLDDKVSVKIMSPLNLDFKDESFDAIITEGILSQYKKSKILKEFFRVLKQNSTIGIADFYWKKTPVPTYVRDVWYIEGGSIDTLDEKISKMEEYGFKAFYVKDISSELRDYYSKFKKIIINSLKERKFSKQEFKELKKYKHEVSVFLDQGGDKWMGYVAICARKVGS
jgi:ubiquinone/menaquinone biosynthesis C-methylase UbiE